MVNTPYDFDGNDSHGYICQDCYYFQNGKCPEEDEGGTICSRFELPKVKEEEFDDVV